MNYQLILFWIARLAAATIMLQTLYVKFTGAPESICIFSTLGSEPRGRYYWIPVLTHWRSRFNVIIR